VVELFRDLALRRDRRGAHALGVFGSSVANVLRRLVRIARHYGSDPRFLLLGDAARARAHARACSARRRGRREDGSPSGARIFGVYNPPMLDAVAGLRANALEEARELARARVRPDHQTIFFCQRRTRSRC
jgi:DEAD/DEAH box helicase domain-containing protein